MNDLTKERINTMKAIIKTNIAFVRVTGYRLWVMGLLLWMALPTTAQPQTFNGATAPQATFQSTNTMMGSGSRYASQPRLSANGQAVYSSMSSTSSGPRRAKMDEDNPFGDDDDINKTTQNPQQPGTPIGDAVWPLTLMCLLAAGVVYLHRRRACKGL